MVKELKNENSEFKSVTEMDADELSQLRIEHGVKLEDFQAHGGKWGLLINRLKKDDSVFFLEVMAARGLLNSMKAKKIKTALRRIYGKTKGYRVWRLS